MAANANTPGVAQMAAGSNFEDTGQIMAKASKACDESSGRLLKSKNKASDDRLQYVFGAVLAQYRLLAWYKVARQLSEARKTSLLHSSNILLTHLGITQARQSAGLNAGYWDELETVLSKSNSKAEDLHALVHKLHDYVDSLYRLMIGDEQKELEASTAQAHYSLVIICNDLKDNRAMQQAIEVFRLE